MFTPQWVTQGCARYGVKRSWANPFGDEQVEIDLGEDNLSELKDFLSPYLAADRPVDRKAKQSTIQRSAPSRPTHDDPIIRA